MSRPTLAQLCGIDTRELKHMTKKSADMMIIASLKAKRYSVASDLAYSRMTDIDYETVAGLQMQLKYLDKAIDARESDLEEMAG